MSEHNGNGAAPQSGAERMAQLAGELAAKVAELEALAVWAGGMEERQAQLEILAAACEEQRAEMAKGLIWLSD